MSWVDIWIKLNKQTLWRDHLARLLVYITQLIRFTLVYYKFQLMRLHGLIILERELSMFRKVLWYGMCVDFLYETLSLDHPDPFIRYMSLCSAFAFVLYLAAEHVAVTLILFFKNANIRYWKTTYREFRLICYSTRLVRDAYEIIIICESKKQLFLPKSYGLWSIFELLFGSVELLNYLYEKHLPLFYDVVMYTCDAALDYEKLKQIRRYTPGFSSGLGLLSALIRCLLMLDPCTRLLPRVSW